MLDLPGQPARIPFRSADPPARNPWAAAPTYALRLATRGRVHHALYPSSDHAVVAASPAPSSARSTIRTRMCYAIGRALLFVPADATSAIDCAVPWPPCLVAKGRGRRRDLYQCWRRTIRLACMLVISFAVRHSRAVIMPVKSGIIVAHAPHA
jgi:hypothetical protein